MLKSYSSLASYIRVLYCLLSKYPCFCHHTNCISPSTHNWRFTL